MAKIRCSMCGKEMQLMFFYEAEYQMVNGVEQKTGRKKRSASCAKCENCQNRILVGTKYDGVFC